MDFSVWKTACRFCGRLAETMSARSVRTQEPRLRQTALAVAEIVSLDDRVTKPTRFSAHRNEPGLRLHPFDPTPNLRKIVQRKAAFVGDVRVGEEGDVGDGIIADKEIILSQVVLP